MKREDDFETRRAHLKNLTEEQLEQRFWELCYEIVDPMIKMAGTHTSPSIERSVLLRMGFSSIEAKGIVDKVIELNLLGKGAGNVVYKLSKLKDISVREAGMLLIEGVHGEEVKSLFRGDIK